MAIIECRKDGDLILRGGDEDTDYSERFSNAWNLMIASRNRCIDAGDDERVVTGILSAVIYYETWFVLGEKPPDDAPDVILELGDYEILIWDVQEEKKKKT